MKNKKVNFIKKYPYFYLLLISGMCVWIYTGMKYIKNRVYSKDNTEMVLEQKNTYESNASDNHFTNESGKKPQDVNKEQMDRKEIKKDTKKTSKEQIKKQVKKQTEKLPEKQIEKQTEKQPKKEPEKQAKKQTIKQAEKQTEKKSEKQTKEQSGKAKKQTEKESKKDTQKNLDKEDKIGVTEFKYYEAKSVSSPYYTDPGKIAYTTNYPYQTVKDTYFKDAAFIGDSRTVGIYDYSGMSGADFYCDKGYCTYLWAKGEKLRYQNKNQNISLDQAMSKKQYAKIYVMIGLNDCGYGTVEDFQNRYSDMLAMIKEKQPNAIIYLMANLYLSKEKSDGDDVYNNVDVNAHNVAIAELADGVTSFYLDSNSLFADKHGNLQSKLTSDGVHLYADGYVKWLDYFKKHAVVKE